MTFGRFFLLPIFSFIIRPRKQYVVAADVSQGGQTIDRYKNDYSSRKKMSSMRFGDREINIFSMDTANSSEKLVATTGTIIQKASSQPFFENSTRAREIVHVYMS